jgi:acetyltransferase-like isoleucine patch superfamily enzyme
MVSKEVKRASVRDVLTDRDSSAARKYRAMVMGDVSWWRLAMFELSDLMFGSLPGALGIFLRRKVFKRFFGACGANVVIGKGCTFRFPGRIFIGNDVVLDDFSCLDARGTTDEGLVLEDRVVVNRLVAIRSKRGDIRIGEGVNIGSASQFISHSGIFVGSGASIAGDCYLSAGTYDLEEMQKPMAERQSTSKGPIEIGSNAWLATRVTVLDAVHVGEGAVIAAGSVVNGNIPSRSIAHGNPAKVIFQPR